MSSAELLKLFRLHEVDAAIAELKKRAAALDPGREIMAQLEKAKAIFARDHEIASTLAGELKDHELQLQTLTDKLKKIDKELYGGSVVNSREVETLEREIQAIKTQQSNVETRILELMDLVPPAKEKEELAQKAISALEKQLRAHHAQVMQTKTQIEADYKTRTARRPGAATGIDPSLMSKYEAIRQKAGGVGMAEVGRAGTCGRCGLSLPEKLITQLKDDKVVVCEGCHRILFLLDRS
ncbi:MAG TPA: hypothetical protein PLO61_01520 [Fimbriimonadaceae bacterium]|nr:hypothetical protein [Fimbriimonadaceae bacterium]HRJ32208.1 hypothetical protein [Fimbriimonadaceae bacterium]